MLKGECEGVDGESELLDGESESLDGESELLDVDSDCNNANRPFLSSLRYSTAPSAKKSESQRTPLSYSRRRSSSLSARALRVRRHRLRVRSVSVLCVLDALSINC